MEWWCTTQPAARLRDSWRNQRSLSPTRSTPGCTSSAPPSSREYRYIQETKTEYIYHVKGLNLRLKCIYTISCAGKLYLGVQVRGHNAQFPLTTHT